MDFPAEFSINVSCLPTGRAADQSAVHPKTVANVFSEAEGGVHQEPLQFPPCIAENAEAGTIGVLS